MKRGFYKEVLQHQPAAADKVTVKRTCIHEERLQYMRAPISWGVIDAPHCCNPNVAVVLPRTVAATTYYYQTKKKISLHL